MQKLNQTMQENALNRRMRRMVLFCIKEEKMCKIPESVTGISSVTDPKQHLIIKILWIFLLLCCIGLSIFQSYERITYYLSYPTAVDVLIKEKQTLYFPGVTLCVQETDQFQDIKKKCDLRTERSLDCVDYANQYLEKCFDRGIKYEAVWNAMNTTSMARIRIKHPKNYTIPSWHQTISVIPWASCVTFDTDHLVPWDLVVAFEVRIPEGACKGAAFRGTMQDTREDPDWMRAWHLLLSTTAQSKINKKEYTFVNRRVDPCFEEDAFKSCHQDCLNRRINMTFTCRFPFLSKSIGKLNCDDPLVPREEVINQYRNNSLFLSETHPVTYCNCTRRCKDVLYSISLDGLGNDKNYTSITWSFLDTYETKIIERLAYKLPDLLCDIGGNIGLCLGMSVLSAINAFYLLLLKFTSKTVKPFDIKDPIYCIVKKHYIAFALNSARPQSCRPKLITLFSYLLTALCAVGSCLFIYLRLGYYYSYPTRVTANTLQNETVTFPFMTICSESKWFTFQKFKASKKSKRPCSKYDLFEPFYGKAFNSTVAWDKTSIEKELLDFHKFLKIFCEFQYSSINMALTPDFVKPIPLPFGNCIQSSAGTHKYAGFYSVTGIIHFVVSAVPSACKPKTYKVFLTAEDEEVDITTFRIEPRDKRFSMVILRKDIRLVSTPIRPCVSSAVYKTCRRNCLEKMLLECINCSLPYMHFLRLPDCHTAKLAKATTETYMHTISKLKSTSACACTPRCNTTLFEYSTLVEDTGIDFPMSLAVMLFTSNIVQIYSEEQIYSIPKFLCDVGGNLGITLGLSVLSMFERMQAFLIFMKKHKVTNYKTKRY